MVRAISGIQSKAIQSTIQSKQYNQNQYNQQYRQSNAIQAI